MTPVLASSVDANVNFAIFLAIAAFGFVFGFFTVRGSGINNHPIDGRGGAPGAKLPDEFHQFQDRQLHDADRRRATRERRLHPPEAQTHAVARTHDDEMTIDDINRRLAAEAAARKEAKAGEPEPGTGVGTLVGRKRRVRK
jgi:hypothetical protein